MCPDAFLLDSRLTCRVEKSVTTFRSQMSRSNTKKSQSSGHQSVRVYDISEQEPVSMMFTLTVIHLSSRSVPLAVRDERADDSSHRTRARMERSLP